MDMESYSMKFAFLVGQSKGGDKLPVLLKLDADFTIARAGLQALGFSSENIIEVVNSSCDGLEHLLVS